MGRQLRADPRRPGVGVPCTQRIIFQLQQVELLDYLTGTRCNGRRVSAAEFMAAISAGTIVEVEGSLNEAGVLLAREAEIETSDDNGESDDD